MARRGTPGSLRARGPQHRFCPQALPHPGAERALRVRMPRIPGLPASGFPDLPGPLVSTFCPLVTAGLRMDGKGALGRGRANRMPL